MTDTHPPVHFVGAGPGDPDLITVKGQTLLKSADTIIYAGSLVPEALLKWASPQCETLNSASMTLMEIVDIIDARVQAGKKVVRLHTGDPSLYGAIFEQMAQLDARSISYGVVPGVTAAFAAAAAMKMEYTLPEVTQTLILTRLAGRTPVPEQESLKSLAAHQASMAIYLSISMVAQVETILSEAYGPESLCAVAYRVSQPDEHILKTPIKDLARTVKDNDITRQALIIVGPSVNASPAGLAHVSKLYDAEFSHGFRSA